MAASCDCISKTNKALEEAGFVNVVLDSHLCMNRGGTSLGLVLNLPLRKKDSKSRKPLPTMIVTYCPICGKKYEKMEEKKTTKAAKTKKKPSV